MKRLLFVLACLASLLGCAAPVEAPHRTDQALVIKRSKIIVWKVSTLGEPTPWATILLAHTAAESHRSALVAAGDDWATPGWPGAGPIDAAPGLTPPPGERAGLNIGKNWGEGLEPALPDPLATERWVFDSAQWFAPL